MLAKNANVKYRIDINALEVGKDKNKEKDDPMGSKHKNDIISNVTKDTSSKHDKNANNNTSQDVRRSQRNKTIPDKYNNGEYV